MYPSIRFSYFQLFKSENLAFDQPLNTLRLRARGFLHLVKVQNEHSLDKLILKAENKSTLTIIFETLIAIVLNNVFID